MAPDNTSENTPGAAILHHLAEKGWTQLDLAQMLDRPVQAINEIVKGKKSITPETAVELATAFKTTRDYWLNLESQYRLSLITSADEEAIMRRVRLFEIAPVKEMQRRGWIRATTTLEELERELCRFFGVENLGQEPQISVATKRPISTDPLTAAQRAWCFRARELAGAVHAEKFRPELLLHCKERLRQLAAYPDETRNVATVLAGFGIRFVVVETMSGTGSKIDGAAFWLAPDKPVIAMSLRFDRIDAFWFTLFHECSHIENGDASVDSELVGDAAMPTVAKPDIERRADEDAANILIPADKLQSFIIRVGPLYSQARINQFAHRMKIHPGIIVGQLHHRGEVKWDAHRKVLAKVRSIVTEVALTDGYGKAVSVDLH